MENEQKPTPEQPIPSPGLEKFADQESVGRSRAMAKIKEIEGKRSSTPLEKQTYDFDDALLRNLYELFVEEKSIAGKELYKEALRNSEKEMRTRWSNAMPGILKKRSELIRDSMRERITGNGERGLGLLTKMGVDVSSFSKKDGKLVYVSKGEREHPEWTISFTDTETVIFRNNTLARGLCAMDLRDFMSIMEKKGLDAQLRQSLQEAKQEESGKGSMEKYDLPATGKMAHIRLFPGRSRDLIAPANLSSAAFLSSALQQRYGDRMMITPLQFTDTPLAHLRELVADGHQNGKGISTFVVDIFEHGTREHIDFVKPLTASDLAALAREFPGCTFQINTIACFGGGLRAGFQKEFANDPDLAKRMHVFLQTKPNLSNYIGHLENQGGENQWSTLYNVFLALGLSEGKTYGEAAMFADKAVKECSPQDAEALINGKLISALEDPGSESSRNA